MLHIILLILKIIGIILLSVLGILLFSLLCALFVPVRYRIEVTREEGEGKPPVEAHIKITWLLHLINVLVCYPADVIVRVRLFIFTVFRIPEKNKKRKTSDADQETGHEKGKKKRTKKGENKELQNSREDSKSVGDEESTDNRQNADSEDGTDKKHDDNNIKDISSEGNPEDIGEENSQDKNSREERESEKVCLQQQTDSTGNTVIPQEADILEETEKNSLSDRIRRLVEKIKGFIEKAKHTVDKIKALFENIQYTIRNFCDKIKSALDNIQYYREVLESDPFKRSMELCKDELCYVLRKLKPDKFDADFTVGMEEPAAMGQILAIYGMLYPLIGQQVRLVGDFEIEGTHIEGQLYIRGRIRAFTFLRVVIRIYLNKDFRRLIKLLKKEAV